MLLTRYYYTLKHLKLIQILYRIWLKLYKPTPDLSASPLIRPCKGDWVTPAVRDAKMTSETSFFFLNESHTLKSKKDWNNTEWSHLWLYNLHYFDDLNAAKSEERNDWHNILIQRWIDENPPAVGVGWEPYPLSLRIVNWIKWALSGNKLNAHWQHSLAIQVRFLSKRLEKHLLGNHLFSNAKALIFAGLFFEGKEADRWYNKGIKIIESEIPEQILPDGGNFELSPMYHSIFLEDMLDLVNVHFAYNERVPCGIEMIIPTMMHWLDVMCHPDDGISFFNDAAHNVAPTVNELFAYANRLGIESDDNANVGVTDLSDSGYTRVQLGDGVTLIDRAAIGPDYLPGHAHADTLSFELSIIGKRVIVNSGTSVYGSGVERQKQRGTASHSTIVIDGEDSSEVWSGFRVARRAKVSNRISKCDGDIVKLSACHDGYARLEGKPMHCREWTIKGNSIDICDYISGNGQCNLKSILPLHPDVIIIEADSHSAILDVHGHQVNISITGNGSLSILQSQYHQEFGLSIENSRLIYSVAAKLPISINTHLTW